MTEGWRALMKAVLRYANEAQQDLPTGPAHAGWDHDVDVAGSECMLGEQLLDDGLGGGEIARDDLGAPGGWIPVIAPRQLAVADPPLFWTPARDDDRAGSVADDVVEDFAGSAGWQDV